MRELVSIYARESYISSVTGIASMQCFAIGSSDKNESKIHSN